MLRTLTKFFCVLLIGCATVYSFWKYVIDRGQMGPPQISRNTTWVTGPTDEDGYIDYFAALNGMRRNGHRLDDNAAIPLMRATGPQEKECDPFEVRWRQLTESGTDTERADLSDVVPGNFIHPPRELWEQLDKARSQAWTRAEFPAVAAWLDSNETAMMLTRHAAALPDLWLPVIRDEDTGFGLATDCDDVNFVRPLARCLMAQSMLYLGEGRVHECRDNLAAAHRLSVLMTRNSSVSQYLIDHFIGTISFPVNGEFLNSQLTTDDLESWASTLRELEPYTPPAELVNNHCRIEMLSAVQAVHRDFNGGFDINVSMKRINQYFDHLNAVLSGTDDGTSQRWLDAFYDPLERNGMQRSIRQIALGGRKTRGDGIATMLISDLAPGTGYLRTEHNNARRRIRLIRVAVTVLQFRAESGRLPLELSELTGFAPDVDPLLTDDIADELTYEHTADGFELSTAREGLCANQYDIHVQCQSVELNACSK